MKKKIVVIGSGLAGSLICDELVNDCDVTLLELGEKDKIQYPKINFINKKFSEVKTFCIGAGGTTNLWHNGLIPINPDDIISDEFREVIFETKPYTNRAATNLYFKNDSYLNDYRNVQFEMNSIAKEIGVFKDGVDCLLYPKKYKRLYVDPKVSSLYGVADIEFIPKNGRIETVEYIKDSKRYSIKPEIIILCAGTLGTPLLVKKIISSLGLNNESVGKGLADHPLAFVGKVKFKSKFNKSMKKISMIDKGNYLCRTAIRLKSHCGTYTACAFFRPALTMENTLQIHKYKSLLGASRGINQIKSCFSIKLFHPDVLAEIFSHVLGANIPGRIYNILMIFEQKRGNNCVSYNDNSLEVDWSISDNELSIYNDLLRKLKKMLSSISDEINMETDITDEWLWSAAHHSGTIALGDSPEGIIDKDLKLKLFDNVYVCDSSVIQEHSYANTGLTIGKLAIRLSELILKRFST